MARLSNHCRIASVALQVRQWLCIIDLRVSVNSTEILGAAEQCSYGLFMSPATSTGI